MVGSPDRRATMDPIARRSREEEAVEAIIDAVLRALWSFRVEIVLVSIAAGIWYLAYGAVGAIGACLVVAILAANPPLWRIVRRLVGHADVRRQFARSVRTAGVVSFGDRVPRVRKVQNIPAGERLQVRVPTGSSVADLDRASEVVAASLGIREVRVRRDPANASLAEVVLARRDPLGGDKPIDWPGADADQLSIWRPIPVGVGEDGQVVTVSLPERNLLLGGEPGAGKSVALSLLVASAALDPWLSALAARREAGRARHVEPVRRVERRRQRGRSDRGPQRPARRDGASIPPAAGDWEAEGR